MASKAGRGRGTQLEIAGVSGATTVTPIKIGEVSECSMGGTTFDIEDVSNFDSGILKEKLGTMADSGTVDVKYNYIGGGSDPGQVALTAAGNGLPYDFTIILPKNAKLSQTTNGDKFAFSAIVKKFGQLGITTKGVLIGSAQLEITGGITFTAGA